MNSRIHRIHLLLLFCLTFAQLQLTHAEGGHHNRTKRQAPVKSHTVQIRLGCDRHHCLGSIVHPSFILTAAKCVWFLRKATNLDKSVMKIVDQRGGRSGEYLVEKVFVMPDYNDQYPSHKDVALIKLTSPINVIGKRLSVVELADYDGELFEYDRVWGFGFGDSKIKELSTHLKAMRMHLMSLDRCEKYYEGIEHDMMCVGNDDADEEGVCDGDGGGPLMVGNKQYGVATAYSRCSYKVYPVVYTSLTRYRKWIMEHIQKYE